MEMVGILLDRSDGCGIPTICIYLFDVEVRRGGEIDEERDVRMA